MTGDADALGARHRRALAYPYERPTGSYVMAADGRVGAWEGDPSAGADRHPVLAIGSNAAPEQLFGKLGTNGPVVSVVAARLRDHDVVFAARVSAYGAVPATLRATPGTEVAVHLIFLTDAQRARLDASEGVGSSVPGYRVTEVDPALLACAVPLTLAGPVPAYVAVAGALAIAGSPVALAAVGARHRVLPSLSETEVLAVVAARFDHLLGPFLDRVTTDAGFRSEVLAALADAAL